MMRLRFLHRRDVLGRAGDVDGKRLFCGLIGQLPVQIIGLDRRVGYMYSRPRWMEEVAKTSTRIEVVVMVVRRVFVCWGGARKATTLLEVSCWRVCH